MQNYIFKYKWSAFKPERLTIKQALAGMLHLVGIDTEIYRRTRDARTLAWRKHAERLQAELDAERLNGWGFCYLTGRRIDF